MTPSSPLTAALVVDENSASNLDVLIQVIFTVLVWLEKPFIVARVVKTIAVLLKHRCASALPIA